MSRYLVDDCCLGQVQCMILTGGREHFSWIIMLLLLPTPAVAVLRSHGSCFDVSFPLAAVASSVERVCILQQKDANEMWLVILTLAIFLPDR